MGGSGHLKRWVGAMVTNQGARLEVGFSASGGLPVDKATELFIRIIEEHFDCRILGEIHQIPKGTIVNIAVKRL